MDDKTRFIRVLLYEGSDEWVRETLANRAVSKEGDPLHPNRHTTITELSLIELKETDGDFEGVQVGYRRKLSIGGK